MEPPARSSVGRIAGKQVALHDHLLAERGRRSVLHVVQAVDAGGRSAEGALDRSLSVGEVVGVVDDTVPCLVEEYKKKKNVGKASFDINIKRAILFHGSSARGGTAKKNGERACPEGSPKNYRCLPRRYAAAL